MCAQWCVEVRTWLQVAVQVVEAFVVVYYSKTYRVCVLEPVCAIVESMRKASGKGGKGGTEDGDQDFCEIVGDSGTE